MIGIMTVRDPLKNCGKETAFISHLLEVQLFIMLYMYNCMYIHELPVIINFYLLVFIISKIQLVVYFGAKKRIKVYL